MFPGNFAVLMKATPEVMDSIYSELEARNPGFTHRGHAEVGPPSPTILHLFGIGGNGWCCGIASAAPFETLSHAQSLPPAIAHRGFQ